jgi:hypothetical protein
MILKRSLKLARKSDKAFQKSHKKGVGFQDAEQDPKMADKSQPV